MPAGVRKEIKINKSGWLEKAALFNYSEIVSKKIKV